MHERQRETSVSIVIQLLNKYQTYRSFAAVIFTALILQVFVLQGLHTFFAHQHDEPVCHLDKPHFHVEGHGHLSCDICLFHFSVTDYQDVEFTLEVPFFPVAQPQYASDVFHYRTKELRKKPRAPPVVLPSLFYV